MVDRGRMRTALEKRELNVTHDSGMNSVLKEKNAIKYYIGTRGKVRI